MNLAAISPRLLVVALLAVVALGSCFAEPDGAPSAAGGMSGGGSGGKPAQTAGEDNAAGVPTLPACHARPAVEGATCRPVVSKEPLRLRLVQGEAKATTRFVDDLFDSFKSHCGGCHVSNGLGGLQVNKTTFPQLVDENVLAALESDRESCELDSDGKKVDPTCFAFMPPAGSFGKPWSERQGDASDPVVRLATELRYWIDQGRPRDIFTLPPGVAGPPQYSVDAEFASKLTNIGSCLPDAGNFATEYDKSCELDAMFAALQRRDEGTPEERVGLPATLDQTDLFTFDSEELGRHGVVAYAPAYPLYTDGAGKLRHIRVPRGYDAEGRELSVRFNPDTGQFDFPENTRLYKTFLRKVRAKDGVDRYRKVETRLIVARANNTALFGTYLWNAEETEARLLVEPLRNGKPFTDKLLTLVIDEPKEEDVHARFDAGEFGKYANLTYQLDKAKVLRRYAVPGSERCIQCHQGSPSQNFVLGFSPLQIHRRECDEQTLTKNGHCEGGNIELTSKDEADQLKRLVELGVITGYDPDGELVKLEDPQGTRRKLRPMRSEAELVAQGYVLGNCSHCHNPNGYATRQNPELGPLLDFLPSAEGGIFQFPLERTSPRIFRGLAGDQPIAYISSSVHDFVTTNSIAKEVLTPRPDGEASNEPIYAPWRSLIYRNVDAPFTYVDDSAIYPHMPLNAPGFDCRAPKILAEWMIGIPSVPKSYSVPPTQGGPQSMVEVLPDSPDYLNALDQTQKRLKLFREGQRSNFCPDTSDIVDLDVVRGRQLIPVDGAVNGFPVDGVPDRPHWVSTDITDPPPPWAPRRVDWDDVVTDGGAVPPFTVPGSDPNYTSLLGAHEGQVRAVALTREAKITDEFREYATKPLPFALWEENPDCNMEHARTLGSYEGAERPNWMNELDPQGSQADRPVYPTLPGAAVYNMVCVNCHGTEADSGGRQASTLQEMTGGNGRVANFRDGLFGPFGSGGENRIRIFGNGDEEAADELASRYVAWMALGGTSTQIPAPILSLVSRTPVAGLNRQFIVFDVRGANMLQVAEQLCRGVALLGTKGGQGMSIAPSQLSYADLHDRSGLIVKNGDAELWKRLCSFNNIAPVHRLRVQNESGTIRLWTDRSDLFCSQPFAYESPQRFSCKQGYPAGFPIGNERGGVDATLTHENFFPWCVQEPGGQVEKEWLAQQRTSDGKPLPLCPATFLTEENKFKLEPAGPSHGVDVWSTRGAINAGLAVYLYLDHFVSQGNARAYRFNECQLYEEQLAK